MSQRSLIAILVLVIVNFLVFPTAFAVDASKVAKNRQTSLGLYYTAVEAHNQMKAHADKTLFLDIRDPVEIHTVGMPAGVDYNVPFKLINTKKWDSKKGKFKLDSNPEFLNDVEARLEAKGLGKDDQVIVICGSGKRAAKAVNAMAKAGYKNVYSVVDGYKGWQKDKLPFNKKLDKKKIYGNPA
jgi:rhodanese-related sulfurtransferase